jgi:hypothetical protein
LRPRNCLWVLMALGLAVPSGLRAQDPHAVLRDAAANLGRSSYAWETTARTRASGESAEAAMNPNAPAVVQGKIDPSSYIEITLLPSRDTLPVPVTAVNKFGDAVGLTPLGWMRRTEMNNARGDKMVDFAGKQVRLSRAFAVAQKAMGMETPSDEIIELMAEAKSYREESGLIMIELRDRMIEKLWNEPRAKNAPEVTGTVIFKLNEGVIAEYHVLLAIGFPNNKTKKTAWTAMQWSTRITGVGNTTVEPAAEAVKKLEEEARR